MNDLIFKGYAIKDFIFENKTLQNEHCDVELENNFFAQVNYSEDDTQCVCDFKVELIDKNNSDPLIHIILEILASFSHPSNMDKQILHVEICNSIYPYARMIISSFTANAGISPIFIASVDFTGAKPVDNNL